MTLLIAILLGLIQGLTEFFPVSSSGHLALFGSWLGLEQADINFDILVHLATLGAIAIVYRGDVKNLALVPISRDGKDLKLLGKLVLATLPAAVLGLLFKDHVEWFHNQTAWVAVFLLVTGLVLLSGLLKTGNARGTLQELTPLGVLAIGFAQALAILPGISRSGMTIMMGLMLGLKKEEAARFSFLMALPAIGGAGILMISDLDPSRWSQLGWVYVSGFLVAFVASLVALKFLLYLLDGKRFFHFGWYCLGLALMVLLFFL